MILDQQLLFSEEQAVTVTAASENIVDFGHDKDVAPGEPLYLMILCTETVTAAGAATVTFDLETDDNSGFSSAAIQHSTGAIGKASLVAGSYVARIALPLGMERYARLNYTVGTGPLTAGKFTAVIVPGFQTND